jgi:hypothetical protein
MNKTKQQTNKRLQACLRDTRANLKELHGRWKKAEHQNNVVLVYNPKEKINT